MMYPKDIDSKTLNVSRSMRFESIMLLHPSTETSRSGSMSVTSMDGAPLSYRVAYKLD